LDNRVWYLSTRTLKHGLKVVCTLLNASDDDLSFALSGVTLASAQER
jgi:hypothetical protein